MVLDPVAIDSFRCLVPTWLLWCVQLSERSYGVVTELGHQLGRAVYNTACRRYTGMATADTFRYAGVLHTGVCVCASVRVCIWKYNTQSCVKNIIMEINKCPYSEKKHKGNSINSVTM